MPYVRINVTQLSLAAQPNPTQTYLLKSRSMHHTKPALFKHWPLQDFQQSDTPGYDIYHLCTNGLEIVTQIKIGKLRKPPGLEGQLPFPYLGTGDSVTHYSVPTKARVSDPIQDQLSVQYYSIKLCEQCKRKYFSSSCVSWSSQRSWKARHTQMSA